MLFRSPWPVSSWEKDFKNADFFVALWQVFRISLSCLEYHSFSTREFRLTHPSFLLPWLFVWAVESSEAYQAKRYLTKGLHCNSGLLCLLQLLWRQNDADSVNSVFFHTLHNKADSIVTDIFSLIWKMV